MQNDIGSYTLFGENPVKAWVVTVNMGYGHLRAVYPLRDIAEEEVIRAGEGANETAKERQLWKNVLRVYEFISRAKGLPLIGNPLFNLLETFLKIPSFYPIRDLSNKTFQVNLLKSSIESGLCQGMLKRTESKQLPVVTSFYATAIAAEKLGTNPVYCIICDADINRVWASETPYESRIEYFAPCAKAAQRLKVYGVNPEKIHVTGFPLPAELLGGPDLPVLKSNLSKRLFRLDTTRKFSERYGASVKHFLGDTFYNPAEDKLTITYAVGGAGAQKEIGGKIARSLKKKILNNKIRLILVAGIRPEVRDYFLKVREGITDNPDQIEIIYADSTDEYFRRFNEILHFTDILWTKPSELSFYCALGIPVLMTSPIGSQEKFNAKWLYETQAGIRQENPDFTNQWLDDMLNKGRLAEAAWNGFLKARKLGTYKIMEVLSTGKMSQSSSPVMR